MSFFAIFNFLGGIALFLYGMKLMSQGLERSAGHRMKSILETLTASPIRGFFLGAFVTAIIQSSAAVIVTLVGFVNTGIMTLEQCISVIIGSNVGTTITAWLLSLTSVEGDAWYVAIFKPSTFAPVLVFLGVCLVLFTKKKGVQDRGNIALGFGILMIGLTIMSDTMKPLANSPIFFELTDYLRNPVIGVAAGLIVTLVLQSSSASTGVLQAMTTTGAITWSMAIPMIIGMNIGSCGVSLISALGANREAKRTAVAHLYFNLVGTILYFILVSILALVGWQPGFIDNSINAFDVAYSHTIYNLILTVILLPLRFSLVRLVKATVRDNTAEADAIALLDERLFRTPAIAVQRTTDVVSKMCLMSTQMVSEAIRLLSEYDVKAAETIVKVESELDKYEDKIGTYLVHLSAEDLNAKENYQVSNLLYLIGDFERIGDHALNIKDSAEEKFNKRLGFSEAAKEELRIMSQAINDIMAKTLTAVESVDLQKAMEIEPLEEVVDDLVRAVRNRHINRMQKGECSIEMGFVLGDLLTNYERIADHCSNVGSLLVEATLNQMQRHAYINDTKKHSQLFQEKYQKYKERYRLPGDSEDEQEKQIDLSVSPVKV